MLHASPTGAARGTRPPGLPHGDDLNTTAGPLIVLIADDDPEVHEATQFALAGECIRSRPLEFRHAYSGKDAVRLFLQDRAISIVLLDVVMESPQAGLEFMETCAEDVSSRGAKVIVRTGQPGHAEEQAVRRHRAVHGYLDKASLTRAILLDAIEAVVAGRDDAPVR